MEDGSVVYGADPYKKIRERQLAAPAESENLQALVINELKTKKHTATEGLLWLVRYDDAPEHTHTYHKTFN